PTFAGNTGATDLAACAATGVELTWAPATFGPSGGTYSVYRDGTLVASGVTASPYVHIPGNSASHAYSVHAVSTDCARVDTSTATISRADAVGDPVPTFAGVAT